MKLLIVNHEKSLTFQLKQLLSVEFTVDVAYSSKQGLWTILTHEYDLIIVDCQGPEGSGFEFCQEVRRNGLAMPILIVSSTTTVENKVMLLNAGADDYLVKPFSRTELLARIKALLRRHTSHRAVVIKHGPLELNTVTSLMLLRGRPLPLTRKEFSILRYLLLHPQRTISRLELLEHIWEKDAFSLNGNTIDVHISGLRHKLGKPYDTHLIQTVHGSGYILI